jgi:hypothetical protein
MLQKIINTVPSRSQEAPPPTLDVIAADAAADAARQQLSEASLSFAASKKYLEASSEEADVARRALEIADDACAKCEESCADAEVVMKAVGEQLEACRCASRY